jgi:Leucine-rich repeat (LRR) protein
MTRWDGCPVSELGLDETDVSDLAFLSQWTNVEVLGLSFTDVRNLSPLPDLPRLKVVDLTGTDVDDSALVRRGVNVLRR